MDQESYNINVISQLEKDRIIELMSGGATFSEAKQQAKNEVLDIFGFSSFEQLPSEKMDISSAGEDNAMLLAASLILQGDRTTGEFSELLSQISLDYKEDGTMNNESIGTELINGINYANLSDIRQNIEQRYYGLGIEYEIPEFEKYVNQFIDQTAFVATNQILFPEQGTYGTNVLVPELKDVELHSLNDRNYSLAVEVPEGRSFKVKVKKEQGLYYTMGTLINMAYKPATDQDPYVTFETTSSGLCDGQLVFMTDYRNPSNLISLEYYSDENPEPFFEKELKIVENTVPVDSTLIK
jgi:hypothetical protein